MSNLIWGVSDFLGGASGKIELTKAICGISEGYTQKFQTKMGVPLPDSNGLAIPE